MFSSSYRADGRVGQRSKSRRRYAFVNGQTTRAPDGTILSGIEFGSGSYNLALNLQEGDITLTSDHTNCFSGDCFPVTITGYQILIKPLPYGWFCDGMLP